MLVLTETVVLELSCSFSLLFEKRPIGIIHQNIGFHGKTVISVHVMYLCHYPKSNNSPSPIKSAYQNKNRTTTPI